MLASRAGRPPLYCVSRLIFCDFTGRHTVQADARCSGYEQPQIADLLDVAAYERATGFERDIRVSLANVVVDADLQRMQRRVIRWREGIGGVSSEPSMKCYNSSTSTPLCLLRCDR